MITSTVSAVLCGACGEFIPEGGSACASCGAARQPEPFFHPVSLFKLAFMGATSSGVYWIWWFWSQWRADAPSDGRWSAALKTVFSGLFFYTMARQVKEEAEKYGVTCRYSPAVLTGLVWATAIGIRVLPDPGSVLLVLLLPVPLIPVQSAINRVNATTSGARPRSWRWWEYAIAIVLGLLWLLIIIGLFLPTPADEGSGTEGGVFALLT